MPTDAAFAAARSRANPFDFPAYYGFDPDKEYVIRSRSRIYNGTTLQGYRFASGECIAPRMRRDATEEQKWNRGERIAWFNTNRDLDGPKYRVYERGTEPPAAEETMWLGQELPEEDTFLDDSGEERYVAAEGVSASAQRYDTYVTPLRNSGEATPEPRRRRSTAAPEAVLEFDPKAGRVVAVDRAADEPEVDDTPEA